MAAYSLDLRERIISDSEHGLTTDELGEKYEVSVAWVNRLKQRYRETGKLTADKIGRKGGSKLDEYKEQITKLIKEQPDLTLAELQEELDVDASLSTIWRVVDALGFRFKKNDSGFRKRSA